MLKLLTLMQYFNHKGQDENDFFTGKVERKKRQTYSVAFMLIYVNFCQAWCDTKAEVLSMPLYLILGSKI